MWKSLKPEQNVTQMMWSKSNIIELNMSWIKSGKTWSKSCWKPRVKSDQENWVESSKKPLVKLSRENLIRIPSRTLSRINPEPVNCEKLPMIGLVVVDKTHKWAGYLCSGGAFAVYDDHAAARDCRRSWRCISGRVGQDSMKWGLAAGPWGCLLYQSIGEWGCLGHLVLYIDRMNICTYGLFLCLGAWEDAPVTCAKTRK